MDNVNSFPDGFIISVASASYQIEGAWNEDGKSPNIWDTLTHTRPELIHNGANGDVACNSYHKYKEDVALVREIGFQMYRFSVSWSRILPNGSISFVNEKGVQYYNNLIDELISNGIEPMVTMFHWDLPQCLQDIGGFVNPVMADYFEDYARLLFQLFGDRVKWWITFNEPAETIIGYCTENRAPALNLPSPADYLAGHTILKAHARAYRMYDKEFRPIQNGKVGITLSGQSARPKTSSPEDADAANRALTFDIGWLAHPIFSEKGDYPELMRKIVDERSTQEGLRKLPHFTAEEVAFIKGSSDFFGYNHYSTFLYEPGMSLSNNYYGDRNAKRSADPSWPSSIASWLHVVPSGFRDMLRYIKDQYNNPAVFITENGFPDAGGLDDMERIGYYKSYMAEMLKAMREDHCNVIGYTAWTLMDNFEWRDGYRCRFGIVDVDFDDPERKRTPKASARFFESLLAERAIPQ